MKSIEINPKGNYKSWQPYLLEELKKGNTSEQFDKNCLFENEAIRIWNIVLLPGERIPFIKFNSNFSFVSQTNGIVITRSSNGRIGLHHIEKEESVFLPLENSEVMYDLENICEEALIFHVTEFKPAILEADELSQLLIDIESVRKQNPPK